MRAFAEAGWYGKDKRWWLLWPLLAPLTLLFIALARVSKWRTQAHSKPLAKPVLVVGNITVGGTGKTPLMVSLVKGLQARGWNPGIVSRGYGARPDAFPYRVTLDSPVFEAGDEPLMLARATGVPLVIDPDRRRAAVQLCEETRCDVILSDDGLQHYRLWRDAEICVLDAGRGIGNGWRLPFGPLRESARRLSQVDWVVLNGTPAQDLTGVKDRAPLQSMQVVPTALVNLATGETRSLSALAEGQWQAICGIGNPGRFFDSLGALDCRFHAEVFADHHAFAPADFSGLNPALPVVMTEKDAVKCRAFAKAHWWYLAIEAQVDSAWLDAVSDRLRNAR
ncbi:tetraacyldisaccharide 4'-kinase [Simiduia agarivorans]|uniref:Tetraacyldisaccharide 4'-kinase n=1 Tax=Simiduia agarivorans (strain DSM 21679 / JCM 13881 / BCRC 17597 / SA1) TaxID=1117647 RepID=K4KEZ6_SIMAS|nr:tetraacyldisaccharide 4'-kinase [Simiduia agarivorans]AFU97516.1 tetraacyldisaccharide 4'-kinase [Simiduia agarivorans SA1 = DSM 21679]